MSWLLLELDGLKTMESLYLCLCRLFCRVTQYLVLFWIRGGSYKPFVVAPLFYSLC